MRRSYRTLVREAAHTAVGLPSYISFFLLTVFSGFGAGWVASAAVLVLFFPAVIFGSATLTWWMERGL